MKAFKVVLKVVLGVALWGYVFALFFIEGTYHPFMKKIARILSLRKLNLLTNNEHKYAPKHQYFQ